jgi:hypothetical protein
MVVIADDVDNPVEQCCSVMSVVTHGEAEPAILPQDIDAGGKTEEKPMPRQIITTADAPGSLLYSQGVKAEPRIQSTPAAVRPAHGSADVLTLSAAITRERAGHYPRKDAIRSG